MVHSTLPSREDAWSILTEFTKSESLLKHALAVEAVMRALAQAHGEDEQLFGLVGLLHDFDYEVYSEIGTHTIEGGRILKERDFPDVVIRAIQSHVTENDISRDSLLEKGIFASDELTGFVVAATLVRPEKDLSGQSPKSVMKKLKDKGFAKGVNRQEVYDGVAGLGVELADYIQFIIDALKPKAESIGLNP